MSDIANALWGKDSTMSHLFDLPKEIFDSGVNIGSKLLKSGTKIFDSFLKFMENPLFLLMVGGIVLVIVFKFL